jgi:UDP-glucose 4-epimerase
MKIVVFGGSGFLGSHVADELTVRGHDVKIFDKAVSPYLQECQEMIIADVLDRSAVQNAVEGADIVYNFIALSDLEQARYSPTDTVKVNVLGNVNILESALEAKVKRFIFSSSIYVYSDAGSFYRSSKQACELFIENYYKVHALDYTILRPGCRQRARHRDRLAPRAAPPRRRPRQRPWLPRTVSGGRPSRSAGLR